MKECACGQPLPLRAGGKTHKKTCDACREAQHRRTSAASKRRRYLEQKQEAACTKT